MKKKKTQKEKPVNWKEVYKKAQDLENVRKLEEVRYCVRRLYMLLCEK